MFALFFPHTSRLCLHIFVSCCHEFPHLPISDPNRLFLPQVKEKLYVNAKTISVVRSITNASRTIWILACMSCVICLYLLMDIMRLLPWKRKLLKKQVNENCKNMRNRWEKHLNCLRFTVYVSTLKSLFSLWGSRLLELKQINLVHYTGKLTWFSKPQLA